MTQEEQRRIWREKFAKKTKESKVAKYKRLEERRKERRKQDPLYLDATRKKWRQKKKKARDLRKDQMNEYMRTRYAKRRETDLPKILSNRRKRDPTIGISTLIKDVRAGRKPARDLVLAISSTTSKLGALIHGSKGGGISSE